MIALTDLRALPCAVRAAGRGLVAGWRAELMLRPPVPRYDPNVVILAGDDRAAMPFALSGWLSRNGRFCAGAHAEQRARADGATRGICETCQAETPRTSSPRCDSCQDERRWTRAKHVMLADARWPLSEEGTDRWFDDESEIVEYMLEHGRCVASMRLYDSQAVFLSEVDESYWEDELYEDNDLPAAVADELENLNVAIRAERDAGRSVAWIGTQAAVDLPSRFLFGTADEASPT